jgi:hypothetical protein
VFYPRHQHPKDSRVGCTKYLYFHTTITVTLKIPLQAVPRYLNFRKTIIRDAKDISTPSRQSLGLYPRYQHPILKTVTGTLPTTSTPSRQSSGGSTHDINTLKTRHWGSTHDINALKTVSGALPNILTLTRKSIRLYEISSLS